MSGDFRVTASVTVRRIQVTDCVTGSRVRLRARRRPPDPNGTRRFQSGSPLTTFGPGLEVHAVGLRTRLPVPCMASSVMAPRERPNTGCSPLPWRASSARVAVGVQTTSRLVLLVRFAQLSMRIVLPPRIDLDQRQTLPSEA